MNLKSIPIPTFAAAINSLKICRLSYWWPYGKWLQC